MRRFLLWVTSFLAAPKIIWDRDGGTKYMARWYLLRTTPEPEVDQFGNPKEESRARWLPHVYLHKFFRSDHDGDLHSHPWRWSLAIILYGGYSEERRVGDHVIRRECKPFPHPSCFNVIRADDYHRVDLLKEESWSLFISGPKDTSWFFWSREFLMRAPWRQYLAWKQEGAATAGWELDVRDFRFRSGLPFKVTCDETNNPQSAVDEGKIIVDVRVQHAAPPKQAIVTFRLPPTEDDFVATVLMAPEVTDEQRAAFEREHPGYRTATVTGEERRKAMLQHDFYGSRMDIEDQGFRTTNGVMPRED